jgi:hypothetical protein
LLFLVIAYIVTLNIVIDTPAHQAKKFVIERSTTTTSAGEDFDGKRDLAG